MPAALSADRAAFLARPERDHRLEAPQRTIRLRAKHALMPSGRTLFAGTLERRVRLHVEERLVDEVLRRVAKEQRAGKRDPGNDQVHIIAKADGGWLATFIRDPERA